MPDGELNRNLAVRTRAEDVWLWKKKRGYTLPQAAKALGMGRTILWRRLKKNTAFSRGAPKLERTPLPLLLALARRRSGRGLRGLASDLGISPPTLLKWERKGEEALVEWWRRRGWKFPEKEGLL